MNGGMTPLLSVSPAFPSPRYPITPSPIPYSLFSILSSINLKKKYYN
jgi:hypothetical protein